MKAKLVSGSTGERTYAAVFDVDDKLPDDLQSFLVREKISSARLLGVGGFRRAKLGYYNLDRKEYEPIAVDEQVEVLSVAGNVTSYEDQPKIHLHAVVGHRGGRTSGGHVIEAIIRPTLELFVEEIPAALFRTDRPEIGIPLIDPGL